MNDRVWRGYFEQRTTTSPMNSCRSREIYQAALQAGYIRVRPVIMTALAMIIGMVPMALGLGEGGEQNAPLGRAVIGGLVFATVGTLFFVPTVFMMMKRRSVFRDAASTAPAQS